MNAAIIGLVFVLGIAPSAAMPRDATVGGFLKAYDQGRDYQREIWDMMILGAGLGFSWSNTTLREFRHEQPLYCQPDELALTVPQTLDILRRAAREDKLIANAPLGAGILLSLEKVFPCPAKP